MKKIVIKKQVFGGHINYGYFGESDEFYNLIRHINPRSENSSGWAHVIDIDDLDHVKLIAKIHGYDIITKDGK